MKKYEKIFETDVYKVELHELVYLTPGMSEEDYLSLKDSIKEFGQLEPIKMYRGKVIDGRNRIKALKELGITKVKYKNLDPQIPLEEVKELVVKGFERRRHQTVTQKAISAYKYMLEQHNNGNKITIGEAAELFGSKRDVVSRVKSLHKIAGDEVIEALFNGKKIIIDKINNKSTDNIRSILNYYKLLNQEIIDNNKEQKLDLTDEEKEFINEIFDNLYSQHSSLLLLGLANKIYKELKRN